MQYNELAMNVQIPTKVSEITLTFEKANYEIYIAGGAVRDVLMGKNVYDWDFTTNATPDAMLKLFSDAFYDNLFGKVAMNREHLHLMLAGDDPGDARESASLA